jgi:hypothetical protein
MASHRDATSTFAQKTHEFHKQRRELLCKQLKAAFLCVEENDDTVAIKIRV